MNSKFNLSYSEGLLTQNIGHWSPHVASIATSTDSVAVQCNRSPLSFIKALTYFCSSLVGRSRPSLPLPRTLTIRLSEAYALPKLALPPLFRRPLAQVPQGSSFCSPSRFFFFFFFFGSLPSSLRLLLLDLFPLRAGEPSLSFFWLSYLSTGSQRCQTPTPP